MTGKALGKRAGAALAARLPRELGRRRLLKLTSGGGALALVGLTGEAIPSAPETGADGSGHGHTRLGFEATEHVRWYYSRARW